MTNGSLASHISFELRVPVVLLAFAQGTIIGLYFNIILVYALTKIAIPVVVIELM